jgi:hypothetical protein
MTAICNQQLAMSTAKADENCREESGARVRHWTLCFRWANC